MRRILPRRTLPLYFIAVLATISALSYTTYNSMSALLHRKTHDTLVSALRMARLGVGNDLFRNQVSATAFAQAAAAITDARISVFDQEGRRLAAVDPGLQSPSTELLETPELLRSVEMARAEGYHSLEYTPEGDPGGRRIFVSVYAEDGDGNSGVLRVDQPLQVVNEQMRSYLGRVLLTAVALSLLSFFISLLLIEGMSRPLNKIREAAFRFAEGDLNHRIQIDHFEELHPLAETLNSMADQLAARIKTVTRQRRELEAILGGMVEGVIVVDRKNKIKSINTAAATFFDLDEAAVLGTSLQNCIDNSELIEFVRRAGDQEDAVEGSLILKRGTERTLHLQIHASVVRNLENRLSRVLIVLNDITRLKHLERIRRDFVANVSHELKTPITTIQGFVETLLDGALDDSQDARRFLEIIASHTGRLNAILEDLLSLSRIEQLDSKIPMRECSARELIENVVSACKPKADETRLRIEQSFSGPDIIRVAPSLLEQAIVNLVNNAIKYSPEASSILVEVSNGENLLRISVHDQGMGIPKTDLPRLFERFYRVDHARSREAGGTGLGLAIVKHIVMAHGGEVSVQSEIGSGSVFSISIPKEESESVEPASHQ